MAVQFSAEMEAELKFQSSTTIAPLTISKIWNDLTVGWFWNFGMLWERGYGTTFMKEWFLYEHWKLKFQSSYDCRIFCQ
ncbi:hypothetical protein C1H46_011153 [Malus baccata]|uniref:Uncharacterized protein n=1 Tax=Malus baccata TaxID=106549 RepID=A0A540MWT3_MALBA|nr:hypothetical protein C1H46_011153 [Malus baccata]